MTQRQSPDLDLALGVLGLRQEELMTTDSVTVSRLRRLRALALCGAVWVAIQINAARAAYIPPPPPAKPGVEIVDDFRYETAEAAHKAWRASE